MVFLSSVIKEDHESWDNIKNSILKLSRSKTRYTKKFSSIYTSIILTPYLQRGNQSATLQDLPQVVAYAYPMVTPSANAVREPFMDGVGIRTDSSSQQQFKVASIHQKSKTDNKESFMKIVVNLRQSRVHPSISCPLLLYRRRILLSRLIRVARRRHRISD